jgi:hypothetical protein
MTMSVKNDWNCVYNVSQSSFDSQERGNVSTHGNGEAPTHGALQEEKPVIDPVRDHDSK